MVAPTINRTGICAWCGSEYVSWDGVYNGEYGLTGDAHGEKWFCEDCGRKSVSWYSLKFMVTEGIDEGFDDE